MLLMMSLTYFCCDTREVLTEEDATAFTARFYTTNQTVAVHSLNLVTVEIDGNLNSTYTLRYGTSGNITLYDKDIREVGQTLAVNTGDSLYFRANIPGSQTLYLELENGTGGFFSDEMALTVTE